MPAHQQAAPTHCWGPNCHPHNNTLHSPTALYPSHPTVNRCRKEDSSSPHRRPQKEQKNPSHCIIPFQVVCYAFLSTSGCFVGNNGGRGWGTERTRWRRKKLRFKMLTGERHVQTVTRGSKLHTNMSMSTYTHTHWKPLKSSITMSFCFRQNVCKIPAAHLYAFSVLEDKNFHSEKSS